MTFSICFLWQE